SIEGVLRLEITQEGEEHLVRAYGERPATVRLEQRLHLEVTVDEPALAASMDHLGWRVYGTNHPQESLPLAQAVLAYREEYLVERNFGRLKGKPLSLSPMYVHSDQRATGLIRLLSLALRLLTLLEFQVRQRL